MGAGVKLTDRTCGAGKDHIERKIGHRCIFSSDVDRIKVKTDLAVPNRGVGSI
jgi:hypothetical protein